MVLRQALELHYADIVSFVANLGAIVGSSPRSLTPEKTNKMRTALRGHLPRSPFWRALERWEALQVRLAGIEEEITAKAKQEIESAARSDSYRSVDLQYLNMQRLCGLAVTRGEVKPQGENESPSPFEVRGEPRSADMVQLQSHAYQCATVPRPNVEGTMAFIYQFQENVDAWLEIESMSKTMSDLKDVTGPLSEELETIVLRRVVTGRCKYCPL